MKASELRIGNLVFNEAWNGEPCEIEVADLLGMMQWETTGKEAEFIKPIPLTEDWLKRFGFKQGDNVTCNDSFYEIPVGGSMLSINPNNGVVWINRNNSSINNPACIDHVHSLQNLYFALTGKELELTP